jgi:hypothetical protein
MEGRMMLAKLWDIVVAAALCASLAFVMFAVASIFSN